MISNRVGVLLCVVAAVQYSVCVQAVCEGRLHRLKARPAQPACVCVCVWPCVQAVACVCRLYVKAVFTG